VRRMKFPGSRALFWAMRDGATVGSILRADSGEKPSLNHAFSRNAARPAKAGLALPVLGQGSGIGRAKLLLSRPGFSAESELTVRYFTRPIPPSGPPTGSALFKMVGRDRQVLTDFGARRGFDVQASQQNSASFIKWEKPSSVYAAFLKRAMNK